ncbi:MAG: response regulator [Dehalococcoidales bacterium]
MLVVDDEARLLEVTVRLLRRRGYEVAATESGEEALRQLAEERFDLLLLDIRMPGVDGFELLRRAKQVRPELVAVMMTAYDHVDNAIQAMELGAIGFVRKPISIDELTAAIDDALARGRLLNENARLRALVPLFELSRAMVSEVDEGRLLELLLDTVVSEVQAEFVRILYPDDGGGLKLGASRGLPACWSPGDAIIDEAAAEAALRREPVCRPGDAERFVPVTPASRLEDACCSVYVPMMVGGEVLGVLQVGGCRNGAHYESADVEFILTLCGQAAAAIANARLFESLKTKQAEIEHLFERIVSTSEEERLRLSLDLHDGPIQSLLGLQVGVLTAERHIERGQLTEAVAGLHRILEALTESARDLRRIVRDLHPPSLESTGFAPSVQDYLEHMRAGDGMGSEFDVVGEVRTLGASVDRAVYHVVREALANARKHSGASRVSVRVEFGDTTLKVCVRDDGRGFQPESRHWQSRDGHIGLRSMRERVRMLGGSLSVDSGRRSGTAISFSIPIAEPAPLPGGASSDVAAIERN